MALRPRSRLDIFLVFTGARVDAWSRAVDIWTWATTQDLVTMGGVPTGAGLSLVEGGFERASLDKLDGLRWYHSGAGGTRVQCPSHAVNVVANFNEAMRTLKAGGEASVQCPECGETFDLNALHFRPEAAVGYAAIVFRDVASAQLGESLRERLVRHEEHFTVVLHRPSY